MIALPALAQDKKIKFSYEEISFGKPIPGARPEQMAFSADGKHAAYPARNEDKTWCVVIDGKTSASFPWYFASSLVWSEEGGRLAYVVQDAENMHVVIDSTPQKNYTEVGIPIFSKDGARCAYWAKADKDYFIVIDGKAEKTDGKVLSNTLKFSPNGKSLAYVLETAGDVVTKQTWVVDGKKGKPYDQVQKIRFSPDSTRYAYSGVIAGKSQVVLDGEEKRMHDKAGDYEFSSDSKHYAYVSLMDKSMRIVVDGKDLDPHVLVSEPRFPTGSAIPAYIARDGTTTLAMIEDKPSKPYEVILNMVLSKDGKHYIFRAQDGAKQFAVIDGKESKPYDAIGTINISDNGAAAVFAGRSIDKEILVLNGKEYEGVGNITISPSGKYVAHMLDRLRTSVLFVNGQEGKTYDGFLRNSKWVFEGEDKLHLMAGKESELIHVIVTLSME